MTCADVAQLLDAFVDAELPAPMLLAVARHAGGCAACDAAIRELTALHEAVERTLRSGVESLDVSGVWPGVEAGLAREEARRAWRRRLRRAPVWGAVAAVAAGTFFWLGVPAHEPARLAAQPRPNQAVIERIDSEGGRLELRRERKYGTTLIMVSAGDGGLAP
jgi:anti-sigma factor RsiW